MKNNHEMREEEYKILFKNSFYSYFANFGNLLFQLIIYFLLAKILTQTAWGYLILATSYITIISIITNYLPPALDYSINYYVSRALASNDKALAKSFILKAIITKLMFIVPIFIASIYIFQVFGGFFMFNLKENINLLYILAPLIFILGFNPILYGINRSLNMYHTVFYMTVITSSIQIIAFLFIILFSQTIIIEFIAIITLFSQMIPFIINCSIIFFWIKKMEIQEKKEESFKEFFQKTFSYGFPISFGYLVYGFWDQIQLQGIGFYGGPGNVTGYNISLLFANNTTLITQSLSNPLITSFSRLNLSQNNEQIIKIYNLTIKYSLFLLLLTSGILFFMGDFILFLIYGESYLVFSWFLKFMINAIIFNILIAPLDALILAQNKGNLIAPIRVIMLSIYLPLFFISLINFGIIGAIISISISNFIIFLIYLFLTVKIFKIKIEIKIISLQYSIYFISLLLTIILEILFFGNLNTTLYQSLNLIFFKYLPFISIVFFVILFILLNLILKTFSINDIEFIKSFLNADKKLHRYIQKVLNVIERVVQYFEE